VASQNKSSTILGAVHDLVPNEHTPKSGNMYNAYELPPVKVLVRYFHATAGYPTRGTRLNTIKAGNYATWSGLMLDNAT
jgi:hypothetical protein